MLPTGKVKALKTYFTIIAMLTHTKKLYTNFYSACIHNKPKPETIQAILQVIYEQINCDTPIQCILLIAIKRNAILIYVTVWMILKCFE